MPAISPILLLLASVVVTVAPLAVVLLERHRRRRALAELARQRGCRFERHGRPEQARRMLPFLPALGAADVRLIDLVICEGAGGAQLIVGRVDYSLGSVRNKRDNTRILLFRQEPEGSVKDVVYGDADQPRMEQYR